MSWWIPILLLGGVGASHHAATRELEYVSRDEQPLLNVWWGLGIGFAIGVTVGFRYHGTIKLATNVLDQVITNKLADTENQPPNKNNCGF